MNEGKLIFSQVMFYLPMHTFRRCVQHYRGNRKIKSFSCLDQFFCMAFGQLTYRESLRDIVTCLRAQQFKLYHMGIRGKVSRSTLADANCARDWRIYADFAQALILIARKLYIDETFGTENCTTSMSSTSSYPNPAPFTSWIGAIWTLHVCTDSINLPHSSLSGPSPIFNFADFIRIQSTK